MILTGVKDGARQQNSNVVESGPRKVWAAPQLAMFAKMHSGSSDEDEGGQADDVGRDRGEVAARMAQYVVEESLFVRKDPPSTPRDTKNSSDRLIMTDLSAELPREDE